MNKLFSFMMALVVMVTVVLAPTPTIRVQAADEVVKYDTAGELIKILHSSPEIDEDLLDPGKAYFPSTEGKPACQAEYEGNILTLIVKNGKSNFQFTSNVLFAIFCNDGFLWILTEKNELYCTAINSLPQDLLSDETATLVQQNIFGEYTANMFKMDSVDKFPALGNLCFYRPTTTKKDAIMVYSIVKKAPDKYELIDNDGFVCDKITINSPTSITYLGKTIKKVSAFAFSEKGTVFFIKNKKLYYFKNKKIKLYTKTKVKNIVFNYKNFGSAVQAKAGEFILINK